MTTLGALGLLLGGILGLGLVGIVVVGYVALLREEKKDRDVPDA